MPRSNPRRFIRHTVNVPLEVSTEAASGKVNNKGFNVSYGGLAFTFEEPLEMGQVIALRIPTVKPAFEARARVVWSRPEGSAFLVGVEFLDATEAFRARMVQQVCSIENYRQEVRAQEGRDLSEQDAASEWIQKFAGDFPDAEIAPPNDPAPPAP